MAKSLYSALFDWIVLRINHALLNKKDMEESVTVSLSQNQVFAGSCVFRPKSQSYRWCVLISGINFDTSQAHAKFPGNT